MCGGARVRVRVCECASVRECARVCASMRECARVCASVREWARVCACVRPWMRACMRNVFAIYDDNILSRLIMIIITIIILYFIQIRHTDDFPSAGIPASDSKINKTGDTEEDSKTRIHKPRVAFLILG